MQQPGRLHQSAVFPDKLQRDHNQSKEREGDEGTIPSLAACSSSGHQVMNTGAQTRSDVLAFYLRQLHFLDRYLVIA